MPLADAETLRQRFDAAVVECAAAYQAKGAFNRRP